MADDSQVWEADEGNAQLLIEEGVRRAAAGEVDEARRFLMRALEAFRRLGQIAGQAGSLLHLAELDYRAGLAADADPRLAQVRALCERPDAGQAEANILLSLGDVQ